MVAIKRNKQALGSGAAKFAVAAILLAVVVIPILSMLTQITGEDMEKVFHGPRFADALINSLVYTLIATAIVVVLAYLLAICTARVDIKCKRLFNIILVLPMLIPSISHGMGLIVLFGQNGVLTNLLHLNWSIYGGVGIVAGSVMYAFPVAYIMLSDVLRYEDMSVYEAAQILGISRMRAFARISLPYMKKPLLAATFSTFAMIVTDYGVPLLVGGKKNTISTLMYNEVIGQLQFGRGAVYGIVLLLPAILAFVVDLLTKDKASSTFVTKSGKGSDAPLHKALAYGLCTVMSVVALLPIAAFALLSFVEKYPHKMNFTFNNFAYIFGGQGADYLRNSLVIALLTALIGTAIGFVTAYLTARMRSPLSKGLHLLAICSMAIPGTVLGISYVMTFARSPLAGTIVLLVMVNTAHFLSSPYLMMYNSFGKMNENLEAVGSTLGIGRIRLLGRVFVPQSFGTLAEMFSYLFVNSMMTISAVSFLSSIGNKPISLMINQFEAQMQYEYAAVVSILILLANLAVKLVVERIKTVTSRRRENGV